MPACLVARIEVDDPDTCATHRARTPAAIAAHGGRFLVGRGAVEAEEGELPEGRIVMVGFPDMATTRRFYGSPDHRAILPLRLAASRDRLYLVEGVREEGGS